MEMNESQQKMKINKRDVVILRGREKGRKRERERGRRRCSVKVE